MLKEIRSRIEAFQWDAIPWWEYESDQESAIYAFTQDIILNIENGDKVEAVRLFQQIEPWAVDDLQTEYRAIIEMIKSA